MPIKLIALSSGGSSLEFENSDIPAVSSAIRYLYGMPDKSRDGIATKYHLGGCSFIFQNEWDDPCLIANSPEGTKILSDLQEAIAAKV